MKADLPAAAPQVIQRPASLSAFPARGFTLLEVIIAFVITLLALGVLFRGATESLDAVQISGRYQEALSRARSRLPAVGRGGPRGPGEQPGNDGSGYRWRVRVLPIAAVPVASGNAAAAQAPRAVLYGVVVTVSWRDGGKTREVRLESRRVGAAPPAAP